MLTTYNSLLTASFSATYGLSQSRPFPGFCSSYILDFRYVQYQNATGHWCSTGTFTRHCLQLKIHLRTPFDSLAFEKLSALITIVIADLEVTNIALSGWQPVISRFLVHHHAISPAEL